MKTKDGNSHTAQVIVAEDRLRELQSGLPIIKSNWIALRVLASTHTNFVLVNNQPLRALAKSAEWCLRIVAQCWK